MRGRNFARRPPARPKRQFGWTASDPTHADIGTGTTAAVIMGASDWERGAGVSQSATLYGIRGFLSLNGLVASARYWAYIGMYDEGETIDAPSSVATFYSEDILWTYAWQVPAVTLTSVTVEINVKVKRKITMDSALYLVSTASAATAVRQVILARSVLRFS